MKVLVTGATGLMGSVLVRQLLEAGTEIRILRREQSKLDLLADAASYVEHVIGDVQNPESVEDAMKGTRQVYHAAASVIQGPTRQIDQLRATNVQGTANVVNAALAAGVERLVHTSSIAALGHSGGHILERTEESVWKHSTANTTYARSKHESERQVYRGIAEGLDAVIVNPSLIFGLGRLGENTMKLIELVAAGRVCMAPDGGTGVVDVRDVAAGHIQAMERGRTGHRYILNAENLSWHAILGTLAAAHGVRAPRRTVPPAVAYTTGLIMEIWATVSGKPAYFTRALARNTMQRCHYSNSKAVQELKCTFRPFELTARRIAETHFGSTAQQMR